MNLSNFKLIIVLATTTFVVVSLLPPVEVISPNVLATEPPYLPYCTHLEPGETQPCDTGQLGICAAGTQTCTANYVWSLCVQNEQATDEICDDGLDNDCDGDTDCDDEDCSEFPACQEPECYPGETQPCDTGNLGICAAGTQTCNEYGFWGECLADSEPVSEICDNGLDDDCDGDVDIDDSDCQANLDFTKTAEDLSGPPLVVGDLVRYTLQITNIGPYWALNITITDDLPNVVTCQNISGDNAPATCTDPVVWVIPLLATSSTATLSIDASINPGSEEQTATNTGYISGENIPPIDPPDPICPDGSEPDENGKCPTPFECLPGATTTCSTGQLGICTAGTQTCSLEGFWGDCLADNEPVSEICDNDLDDDCDGYTDCNDENCFEDSICQEPQCEPEDTQTCNTGNLGICAAGTQTCNEHGFWGECIQDEQAGDEICDNDLDDDCDGDVDIDDSDCQERSITVTSPNGGEKWVIGNTYEIKWQSSGIDKVDISLCGLIPIDIPGNCLPVIAEDISADLGKYSWTIPSDISPKEDGYRIRIFDGGTTLDDTDGYFSIALAEEEKFINVTSPAGGEKWKVGETYDITWTSSGIDFESFPYVAIFAIDYCNPELESPVCTQAEGQEASVDSLGARLVTCDASISSGKYSWEIPANFEPCDQYEIYVDVYGAANDESDDYFSIVKEGEVVSGRGGGGGPSGLAIFNEMVKKVLSDRVIVTWFTNIPATSRVIYDTVSHYGLGAPPNYGYAYSTPETDLISKVTFHTVTITDLIPGVTYYWRAISHGSPESWGKELTFTIPVETLGETEEGETEEGETEEGETEEGEEVLPPGETEEIGETEEGEEIVPGEQEEEEEEEEEEEGVMTEEVKTGFDRLLAAIGGFFNLGNIYWFILIIIAILIILYLLSRRRKAEKNIPLK